MTKLYWLILILVLVGCSVTTQQDPTDTPLPTVAIPTSTATITNTPLASNTPLPTNTPTLTPTPPITNTPTITLTPMPSSTPFPQEVAFVNDNWAEVDIPNAIDGGLSTNWLAFTNIDEDDTQTLYLINPTSLQRVEVAELPATVDDNIFWSPGGTHLMYFVQPDAGTPRGLYMLDLQVGLSYRVFDVPTLNPRGIPGHVPSWSGNGERVAFALPTDYATDIFVMEADGLNFRNVTQHGSYDMWPSFSPDGLWLAFVSDRVQCPTWTPNEPNTCDRPGALVPNEGNLYVLNMNTAELRQVTDVTLNGPPQWITNTELVFSTGGNNALATESQIWRLDIEAGTAVNVSQGATLNISESWNSDASRVIYQQVTTSSQVVIADDIGRQVSTTSEYIFPRYGMAADWSPDGQLVAIGGRNGQCPYGLIVADPVLEIVTEPATNLLACDPIYAPVTNNIAYMGIRPGITTDGRQDVYLSNLNGVGARNLTSNLRGQMRLLGWVGPTEAE